LTLLVGRQEEHPAPHHSVFTGQMPFLPPNQQRQSTDGSVSVFRYFSTPKTVFEKKRVQQLNDRKKATLF